MAHHSYVVGSKARPTTVGEVYSCGEKWHGFVNSKFVGMFISLTDACMAVERVYAEGTK